MVHVLLLVRHAKAVGDAASDPERRLAPQGVRDAGAAGRWLLDRGLILDRVVVSPARRAIQTWDAIGGELRDVPAAVIDDRIYDNTVDALLAVVRDTAESVHTVAVVGHNPSMHAVATVVDDGGGDSEARRGLRDAFPTMGIAVLDVTGDWAALTAGSGTLREVVAPRG